MEKNPRSPSLSQVKYNREREVRLEAGGVQNGQEVLFVEEVHVVEEPVEENLQLKQATKIFRGCLWQPLYCFHFDFRYVTLVR